MEGGHFGSDDNTQDWDWEVLVPQSDNQPQQQLEKNPSSDLRSFPNSDEDELDICSDYFSLDRVRNPDPNSEPELELKRVESDNSGGSWMDPAAQFSNVSRVGKRRRNYSSDESEASEISDYGGSSSGSRNQLLVLQPHSDCAHHSSHLGKYDCKELEGFSGHNHGANFDPLANAKSHLGDDTHDESANGNESGIEIGSEIESPINGKFDHDKVEEELGVAAHSEIINGEESKEKDGVHENKNENVGVAQEVEQEKGIKDCSENENGNEKSVVWWRVPLEVIKYCVLRVSPVWSLSVAAAAIMGFVLYRRRWLSKMKRKSQGIQLNITVDDKKVSQFMSRAARLNEAFSVVKRVPIIRPALPAPGLASWPVMSLR